MKVKLLAAGILVLAVIVGLMIPLLFGEKVETPKYRDTIDLTNPVFAPLPEEAEVQPPIPEDAPAPIPVIEEKPETPLPQPKVVQPAVVEPVKPLAKPLPVPTPVYRWVPAPQYCPPQRPLFRGLFR